MKISIIFDITSSNVTKSSMREFKKRRTEQVTLSSNNPFLELSNKMKELFNPFSDSFISICQAFILSEDGKAKYSLLEHDSIIWPIDNISENPEAHEFKEALSKTATLLEVVNQASKGIEKFLAYHFFKREYDLYKMVPGYKDFADAIGEINKAIKTRSGTNEEPDFSDEFHLGVSESKE